jgi:signal transduction histidine kinase
VARAVVATGDYAGGCPAVRVTGAPAPVLVPAAYLERIIANLVENAGQFASSQVDVRVYSYGETTTLEVRDDGPGVPVAQRAHIFERFVRLDEARDRDHGGFGLGLAIVADLCHAYGGTIEVGDADPGAVFCVRFPLAQAAAVRQPAAAPPAGRLEPARR